MHEAMECGRTVLPCRPHYRHDKHRTHFEVEYDKRFDEGKLKNEIQYMWPGKEQQIEFEFTGPSVQAILDRIPKSKSSKGKKIR